MKPPRHRRYGYTPEEWAELLIGELELDAVSIWQIAGAGAEEFELDGDDLEQFIRLMSTRLLERGAVLMRGEAAQGGRWVPVLGAEAGRSEMLEEALAHWRREGATLDLPESWWFILPELRRVFA